VLEWLFILLPESQHLSTKHGSKEKTVPANRLKTMIKSYA